MPYYYPNFISNRESPLFVVTPSSSKHLLGRKLSEATTVVERNLTLPHRDPILILSSACNPEYMRKIRPHFTVKFCLRKLYTEHYDVTENHSCVGPWQTGNCLPGASRGDSRKVLGMH